LLTVGCASGRIRQAAKQSGVALAEANELVVIAETKYRKPFVWLSKEGDNYRVMLGDRFGGTFVIFKKDQSQWTEIETGPWWAHY
jgi:hypothetical protein